MTSLPRDYVRCPHCGHDATRWAHSAREWHRIAIRKRRCAACGRDYTVAIGTVTDNPTFTRVLTEYADLVNAGQPTGEAR